MLLAHDRVAPAQVLAACALASIAHVHAGTQSSGSRASRERFPHGLALRKIDPAGFSRRHPAQISRSSRSPRASPGRRPVTPRVIGAAYAVAKGAAGSCCARVAVERTTAELLLGRRRRLLTVSFSPARGGDGVNVKHLAQSVQERARGTRRAGQGDQARHFRGGLSGLYDNVVDKTLLSCHTRVPTGLLHTQSITCPTLNGRIRVAHEGRETQKPVPWKTDASETRLFEAP